MGQDHPPPRRKSATAQETFSSAGRVASADERRHVLPKDLPNAVKHLNDEELDRLLNAVHAAFKAGITPARIARQFGLSQSDVKKALKSDKRE